MRLWYNYIFAHAYSTILVLFFQLKNQRYFKVEQYVFKGGRFFSPAIKWLSMNGSGSVIHLLLLPGRHLMGLHSLGVGHVFSAPNLKHIVNMVERISLYNLDVFLLGLWGLLGFIFLVGLATASNRWIYTYEKYRKYKPCNRRMTGIVEWVGLHICKKKSLLQVRFIQAKE